MAFIDLTGRTFGRLTVIGRSAQDYISPGGQRRIKWDAQCECGRQKAIVGTTLRQGRATSCGCYQAELRVIQGRANASDRPTYSSAHQRLRRAKGRAANHRCVDCGGPARTWSYRHGDPKELTEPHTLKSGRVILLAYSLDPAQYEARCTSCHTKMDVALRRGARRAS